MTIPFHTWYCRCDGASRHRFAPRHSLVAPGALEAKMSSSGTPVPETMRAFAAERRTGKPPETA
jgi:hypothetical protein